MRYLLKYLQIEINLFILVLLNNTFILDQIVNKFIWLTPKIKPKTYWLSMKTTTQTDSSTLLNYKRFSILEEVSINLFHKLIRVYSGNKISLYTFYENGDSLSKSNIVKNK